MTPLRFASRSMSAARFVADAADQAALPRPEACASASLFAQSNGSPRRQSPGSRARSTARQLDSALPFRKRGSLGNRVRKRVLHFSRPWATPTAVVDVDGGESVVSGNGYDFIVTDAALYVYNPRISDETLR